MVFKCSIVEQCGEPIIKASVLFVNCKVKLLGSMKLVVAIVCIFLSPSFVGAVSPGCGWDIPAQPTPGSSGTISITVDDPNLGTIERSFVLHLPAGYSPDNDVSTPIVLDFHGFSGTGESGGYSGGLDDVSDEDPDGGFFVVHGNGCGETSFPGRFIASWNCSRTDGPLGPPCVLPRPENSGFPCYDSCGYCDRMNSCDWTSCCDDVAFVEAVLEYMSKTYCLDEDSVHLTGISNGGIFSYYAASRLNGAVASIAPVAGSPLLGFGEVPTSPVSLIDFHGLEDTFAQYDLSSPGGHGEGPESTVITGFYLYYEQKPLTVAKWVDELGCGADEMSYPTDMDGIDGWACSLWSGCRGGAEVVSCTGEYGHTYPFGNENPPYLGGSRILWEFMKNHRRITEGDENDGNIAAQGKCASMVVVLISIIYIFAIN